MATRTEILLIDDVDGGEASETVVFALDGVTYEIDLSDENASRFRDAIGPWAAKARRGVASATASKRVRTTNTDRSAYLKKLRAWGKEQGYSVPDRGRVPADVEKAYQEYLAAS